MFEAMMLDESLRFGLRVLVGISAGRKNIADSISHSINSSHCQQHARLNKVSPAPPKP
jgi:hypothetical protein